MSQLNTHKDKVAIYTLRCPSDGSIRYVGQSCDPDNRYRAHLSESGNTRKCIWLQSLLSSGLQPRMEIVEWVDSSFAMTAEAYWITRFQAYGNDLTNIERRPARTVVGGASVVIRECWRCVVCGHEWLQGEKVPIQCASGKCRSRRWNYKAELAAAAESVVPTRAAGEIHEHEGPMVSRRHEAVMLSTAERTVIYDEQVDG